MLLGKGAFGMVYQALLSTGAIIAVKQVEMEENWESFCIIGVPSC